MIVEEGLITKRCRTVLPERQLKKCSSPNKRNIFHWPTVQSALAESTVPTWVRPVLISEPRRRDIFGKY
jgi:hypothetical protein